MWALCFRGSMDANKNNALLVKYSSALMSNHKWQKLFFVMAEYGSNFAGIEYHFTDTDNVQFGHAPFKQQIWDTAIDDPVNGVSGPVEYKHIESIMVPYVYKYRAYKNGPIKERPLNVEAFINALNAVGSFPITETEDGIVIRGYQT